MKYFISDLHFYDEGLMKYCDRPFSSVEEMHNIIIKNFRNKVDGKGEIYVLGDIAGKNSNQLMKKDLAQILDVIGINNPDTPFHLILGNRDIFSIQDYMDMGFISVMEIDYTQIGKLKTMITHDPCMIQQKNTLALCGHIHTLFEYVYNAQRNTLAINVGVEVRNYTPVSEEEIIAIIENTEWINPMK
jgi:calcineurin-like phosphoesterase family protein